MRKTEFKFTNVLRKRDRCSRTDKVKEEKRCPRCGSKEKVKNRYNKGQQTHLCKECGRNYTGTKNGYPESTKKEA